jgi:hypothetical protein
VTQTPPEPAGVARTQFAAALEHDIGLWAALTGIDAIWIEPGRYRFNRQYLVGNRAAMFVDAATAETGEPDWSGYGWVDCACGQRHRVRYGAAGLLLTHRDGDGTRWVLMQQRSASGQHTGTWGLPGGARDYREPAEWAAREGWEDVKLDLSRYRVRGSSADDHCNWS